MASNTQIGKPEKLCRKFQIIHDTPLSEIEIACTCKNFVSFIHALDSLIPRSLPDFILQLWRKLQYKILESSGNEETLHGEIGQLPVVHVLLAVVTELTRTRLQPFGSGDRRVCWDFQGPPQSSQLACRPCGM